MHASTVRDCECHSARRRGAPQALVCVKPPRGKTSSAKPPRPAQSACLDFDTENVLGLAVSAILPMTLRAGRERRRGGASTAA